MKIISPHNVYRTYVTYRSHFNNQGTDISKYNFRLFKIGYDKFLETRGIGYYDKLAKKTKTEKNTINLFITAFMNEPSIWIGEIVQEYRYYNDLTEKRLAKIDDMPYLFRKDCLYLLENGMKFDNNLDIFVFRKFMESEIELETFFIFKKIFNFKLDNNIDYDYSYRRYEKYEKIFKIDTEKYKLILKKSVR